MTVPCRHRHRHRHLHRRRCRRNATAVATPPRARGRHELTILPGQVALLMVRDKRRSLARRFVWPPLVRTSALTSTQAHLCRHPDGRAPQCHPTAIYCRRYSDAPCRLPLTSTTPLHHCTTALPAADAADAGEGAVAENKGALTAAAGTARAVAAKVHTTRPLITHVTPPHRHTATHPHRRR